MEQTPKQKINIVSNGDESLASHRMRCSIPCEMLNLYSNYEVKITDEFDENSNINIFHKHFNKQKNLSDAIMGADVSRIVFDICDDWFDREHGKYYEDMCELADVITCHSINMQSRIYEATGRLAQIAADPITFPFHPATDPATDPKVVWYGHSSNLFSVMPYAEKIRNLTIITNVMLPHSKATSKVWKPNLVENSIDLYDIVIIPKIHTPEAKNKSPNRAVDALHAGRFVIAESEEVYGELMGGAFIGPIEEGLTFYKNNPDKVKEMIERGQQYVLDNYNPRTVCDQWVRALNYVDYSKFEGP